MVEGTQLMLPNVAEAIAQPLDLSRLASHLWESANILRGPVDAADFKTYFARSATIRRFWCGVMESAVPDSSDGGLTSYMPPKHWRHCARCRDRAAMNWWATGKASCLSILTTRIV
jgi:hypothetical protein